jgi:hypothetical protein
VFPHPVGPKHVRNSLAIRTIWSVACGHCWPDSGRYERRHGEPRTSTAYRSKRPSSPHTGAPYTRKLRPAFACYQNRAFPIGTSQSTVLEGSTAKQVRAHDLYTPLLRCGLAFTSWEAKSSTWDISAHVAHTRRPSRVHLRPLSINPEWIGSARRGHWVEPNVDVQLAAQHLT